MTRWDWDNSLQWYKCELSMSVDFTAFSEASVLAGMEDRILNTLHNCTIGLFDSKETMLLFCVWKSTISPQANDINSKAW